MTVKLFASGKTAVDFKNYSSDTGVVSNIYNDHSIWKLCATSPTFTAKSSSSKFLTEYDFNFYFGTSDRSRVYIKMTRTIDGTETDFYLREIVMGINHALTTTSGFNYVQTDSPTVSAGSSVVYKAYIQFWDANFPTYSYPDAVISMNRLLVTEIGA